MKLHGAIPAWFFAWLALAGSSALGGVALNCDLSDCGLGGNAHQQLHAETAKVIAKIEHDIRGRIEEIKSFNERLFCFDTRECSDSANEHCYQAPHCGFPSDNRNCVGVLINCQKLCGATDPHVTQESATSPLALVVDSADPATESSVSPTENSLKFVVAADPPTVPDEANPPPQSQNEPPKTTDSDSSNAPSDVVQNDVAKPTAEFTALDSEIDSSNFSPPFVISTDAFDPPAPGPFVAAAAVPAPFTASVLTDSFGPVAYEGGGSQSANPEPASIVIWCGMGAIALGIHTSRRRHGRNL